MNTKLFLGIGLFCTFSVKGQSIEITPSGTATIYSSNATNYFTIRKTGTHTLSGLRFYQNAVLGGGLYYSDENTLLNLSYSGNQAGMLWKLNNTSMGVGTFNPEAKIHIHANSTAIYPHLLLKENNNADGARINFENFSIDNKRWTLYGINSQNTSSNLFNIYHSDFGNVVQFTGEGNTRINGFTQLGEDAPLIKMRKFTGFLTNANSHTLTLPVDIDFSKIVDYNTFITVNDPELLPIGNTDFQKYKYFPHDNNPTGFNYRSVVMQDFSSGLSSPPAQVSFTNIGNKLKQKQYTIIILYEL